MRLQKYMYVCLNDLCKGVLGLETYMDYFAHPEVAVKKKCWPNSLGIRTEKTLYVAWTQVITNYFSAAS